MVFRLEYAFNKFLEIELYSLNYFIGPNEKLKRQIIHSLKRLSCNKLLTIQEEKVYGDDGIGFSLDGQSEKNVEFHFLMSEEDFKYRLQFNKNAMMEEYLNDMQNDFDINKALDILNNQLLELELIISKKSQLSNIQLIMPLLTFQSILKQSKLIYGDDESLELLDANLLLHDYMYLLERYVLSNSKTHVLVLRNVNSFLDEGNKQLLLDFYDNLSKKTNRFFVFIFQDEEFNNMDKIYLEQITILHSRIEQLPPLDIFENSIMNNYPMEYKCKNLEEKISYLLLKIGKNDMSKSCLNKEDMLLLNTIEDLLI